MTKSAYPATVRSTSRASGPGINFSFDTETHYIAGDAGEGVKQSEHVASIKIELLNKETAEQFMQLLRRASNTSDSTPEWAMNIMDKIDGVPSPGKRAKAS